MLSPTIPLSADPFACFDADPDWGISMLIVYWLGDGKLIIASLAKDSIQTINL